MGIGVNINGAWKDMLDGWVNINGVWKKIDSIHTNINGVWKKAYSNKNVFFNGTSSATGEYQVSTDGLNWVTKKLPVAVRTDSSSFVNNRVFIKAGTSLYQSLDYGNTFTLVASGANYLPDIYAFGYYYSHVGSSIMRSSDLITWVNNTAMQQDDCGIHFHNGYIYAGTYEYDAEYPIEEHYVKWTSNGTNWSSLTVGSRTTDRISKTIVGNGKFAWINTNGAVRVAPAPSGAYTSSIPASGGNTIRYGFVQDGLFYVSYNVSTTKYLKYSTDLINWVLKGNPNETVVADSMIYHNGYYYGHSGSTGSYIKRSSDAINWSNVILSKSINLIYMG